MKNLIPYYLLLFLGLLSSCEEKKEQEKKTVEPQPVMTLPFQALALNNMADFKTTEGNWKIAGGVYVDRSQLNLLSTTEGSGVLANNPDEEKRDNLITIFEHGDIEFECDVMVPVNSNSGIYFQSRYELQLFDSWGVVNPKHGDMGGIYERWDKTKEKGKEGYEGNAPKVNAAKAPGLWQHLKVIFHAPKFDESGKKIKNAQFEEVRLNGALIHQNVEVSGPTRGGADNEVSQAPILIQGDHGPMAFRNIKYKLYKEQKVQMVEVKMKEYENALTNFPNLDSLVAIREVTTDSISATMATGERPQKLLSYTGKLIIPESGDYIFDFKLNRAGGAFLIDNDTVISMNGNYSLDSLQISKVTLKKGEVPFHLIYNKHVPWQIGFGLYVEGPDIQKHALHGLSSLKVPSEEVNPDFLIPVEDKSIAQRGFWMHEGEKRTHCIAVGNPQGVHFAYDLESGSLLQAWSGDFVDATKMWQGRGEKQLAVPAGFVISLHGDPELVDLNEDGDTWPSEVSSNKYRQLGYEFGGDGFPIFSYQMDDTKVSNKFIPTEKNRGLTREITVNGSTSFWFKVADGAAIEKLPDATFVVNDEGYFIDFENDNLESKIRKSTNWDELLVRIPSGEQQINYSIIW